MIVTLWAVACKGPSVNAGHWLLLYRVHELSKKSPSTASHSQCYTAEKSLPFPVPASGPVKKSVKAGETLYLCR